MALTNLEGFIPAARDLPNFDSSTPAYVTALTIDASTELCAFIGEVWHPTVKTGTINIRKVHFRCGAVTLNGASAVRISLQSVSATAGPPYQPNGTVRGAGAAGYADLSTLTANGMNVTGAFGADVAVDLSADSIGDTDSRWLAVVFAYQTFTAADSVIVSMNSSPVPPPATGLGGGGLLNTGSWAFQTTGTPIVILECDDGTFAFMRGCFPFSAFSSASVASNGAIRRAGMKFRVPVEMKASSFSLMMQIPNGCDGRLVLYDSDGTTELASVDVDNDAVSSAGVSRIFELEYPYITLAASTYYRFVFLAGTTTAAVVYYGNVGAAGHMDGLIGGQDFHWTQHDGTNWADTTTRRPHFGFGIAAVHDGSGSGGGGLRLAGHGGLAA